jgi:ornithine cyclodeaminase/alanine dehydrogenase-like protein (mu-crystallin family)
MPPLPDKRAASALDETKLFNAAAVCALVDLRALVGDIHRAYGAGLRSQATIPPRFGATLQGPERLFGVMPAICDRLGLFVVKSATHAPPQENGAGPTIQSLVVAFSTQDGRPVAVLDGAAITGARCAASTALATDLCTTRRASRLALIGSGVVAAQMFEGVRTVRTLDRVTIHSRRSAMAERFAEQIRVILPPGARVEVAANVRQACQGQDIICTGTTWPRPLVALWPELPANLHINCMGAYTRRSREVARAVLQASRVLVEDRALALREAGGAHQEALELSEALRPGQDFRRRLTVFSSTGDAFLDLVTTAHVLRRAGLA